MAYEVKTPSKLSPDGSGRFFMMAHLLDIFFVKARNQVKILDVGGSSLYMPEVLKNAKFAYDMTTIDILPKPKGFKGKYIQGDATKTDFVDGEFSTVITTDVLEHIPPHLKDAFVKECIRVAKDYVIIAAPFDTVGVDEAEHATNDLNKRLFKQGQAWLEEHFEYKKPSLERVVSIAKKAGYEPYVIGTNNLYLWLASTHVNLIGAKLGINEKKHSDANALLNQTILESGDMAPPFYRHFVVITKQPLSADQRKKLEALTSIKSDHKASVRYMHDLMTLIAESMGKTSTDLKESQRKNSDNQRTIDALRQEIKEKDELISKARYYLKLKTITPEKITKKVKKLGGR